MKKIFPSLLSLLALLLFINPTSTAQGPPLECSFGNEGILLIKAPFSCFTPTDIEVYQSGPHQGKMVVSLNLCDDPNDPNIAVGRFLADGTPDPTFGQNGYVGPISIRENDNSVKVLIQADDKVVVVGNTNITSAGSGNRTGLAMIRLNPNGSFDNSFGSNGKVVDFFLLPPSTSNQSTINDAILDQNGKVVVCGTIGGVAANKSDITAGLARFNLDGSRDVARRVNFRPNFGGFAGKTETFKGLSMQSSNKIVAVGELDGGNLMIAARVNSDFTIDNSFGSNGNGREEFTGEGSAPYSVSEVRVDGVDDIIFGYTPNITDIRRLMKRGRNGGINNLYGNNGTARLDDGETSQTLVGIEMQYATNNDKVIAYGRSSPNGDFAAIRANSSGQQDNGFGILGELAVDLPISGSPTAAALQPDGKLIMIGSGANILIFVRMETTSGATRCAENPNFLPIALCKDYVAVLTGGSVTITAADVDNGSFSANNPFTVSASPLTFNSIGPKSVTLNITDGLNFQDNCNAAVFVSSGIPPNINCPSNIVQNHTPGKCGRVVNYQVTASSSFTINPVQTDLSGLSSGDEFPVGVTTQSWEATDPSGLKATCSFSVTINDNTVPTIDCPQSVTLDNDQEQCGALFAYRVEIDDNCPNPSLVQVSGQATGSLFPIGNTNNQFRVTDASGNTAGCSFVVTVNDTTVPSITCPQSVSLDNDFGACGAVFTYTVPIGDNCPNPSLVQDAGQHSGTEFPLGITTNSFTLTDASGNTSTCSFTVSVSDTVAPDISIIGDDPIILCEGDPYVEAGATATDNCFSSIQAALIIDNSSVDINESGTYTVTYNVTDDFGNSATERTRTVQVKHRPAQLDQQNCGNCNEIRFDFCEGDTPPILENLLMTNDNYEAGITFIWYEDNGGSPGSIISQPDVNTNRSNKRFYWVSQKLDCCESPLRRIRVRVRKTSTVVLALPDYGCNPGQIDLAAWVSDSRRIATAFHFYDANPIQGANPVGTATATKGRVNNGQQVIVTIPPNPIVYYATAENNTGCQNGGNDLIISTAVPLLDPISSQQVNAGDVVNLTFNSPNATRILWVNSNNPNIGILGTVGLGNLSFTAVNQTSSPQTAILHVIPYINNCAGPLQEVSITVNPGGSHRLAMPSLKAEVSRTAAIEATIAWEIRYNFPLSHMDVERLDAEGNWQTLGTVVYQETRFKYNFIDPKTDALASTYRIKFSHPDGRAFWSEELVLANELLASEQFAIAPNPTDGRLSISTNAAMDASWSVELLDPFGRQLLSKQAVGAAAVIDVSHLASGYYLLVITSHTGRIHHEKLIKE